VCHLKSVPFRGVQCSDAAGKQFGFSDMMDKVNQSFTGILWDNIAQSPFATYKVIVLPYLVNVTVNHSHHGHNCTSLRESSSRLPYCNDENKVIRIAKCDTFSAVCESFQKLGAFGCKSFSKLTREQ